MDCQVAPGDGSQLGLLEVFKKLAGFEMGTQGLTMTVHLPVDRSAEEKYFSQTTGVLQPLVDLLCLEKTVESLLVVAAVLVQGGMEAADLCF